MPENATARYLEVKNTKNALIGRLMTFPAVIGGIPV